MADEYYRIEIPIVVRDESEGPLQEAEQRLTRFEQSVLRSRNRLLSLNSTRSAPVVTLQDRVSGTITLIRSRLTNLVRTPYRLTVRVLDLATAPLRGIFRMVTSIPALVTGTLIGAATISRPLEVSGQLEQLQIAFQTLFKDQRQFSSWSKAIGRDLEGPAEAADTFLKSLQRFAIITPYRLREVVNNARMIMAYGFESASVEMMLRTLGDTVSALGGGEETMQRLTYAIGQINAKGRLMQEELRQIANIGVPIFQILQEELGLSFEQLSNVTMLQIPSDVVIDSMLRGFNKRYGGAMALQEWTLFGLSSFMQDVFDIDFARRWGDGLRRVIQGTMRDFRRWYDNNDVLIDRVGDRLEEMSFQAGSSMLNVGMRGVQLIAQAFADPRLADPDASLLQKMSVLWERLVLEPFQYWWTNGGREATIQRAHSIGRTLGEGLKGFLLGAANTLIPGEAFSQVPEDSILGAGITAGKSFMQGFIEGFDASLVISTIFERLKNANVQGFQQWREGGGFPWQTLIMDFLVFRLANWLFGGLLGKGLGKGGGLLGGLLGRGTGAAAGAAGSALGSVGLGRAALSNGAKLATPLAIGATALDVLTSEPEDRWRAGIGGIGLFLGGILGGALGGLLGPVGGIAGGVAGAGLGKSGAQWLYDLVASMLGNPQGRANGEYVTSRKIVEVGESGPELILPLTRPTRSEQLLRQALPGLQEGAWISPTGALHELAPGQTHPDLARQLGKNVDQMVRESWARVRTTDFYFGRGSRNVTLFSPATKAQWSVLSEYLEAYGAGDWYVALAKDWGDPGLGVRVPEHTPGGKLSQRLQRLGMIKSARGDMLRGMLGMFGFLPEILSWISLYQEAKATGKPMGDLLWDRILQPWGIPSIEEYIKSQAVSARRGALMPGFSGPDQFLANIAPGEAVVPSDAVGAGPEGVLGWFKQMGVPGFQDGMVPELPGGSRPSTGSRGGGYSPVSIKVKAEVRVAQMVVREEADLDLLADKVGESVAVELRRGLENTGMVPDYA